jgi:hypothetical protein
VSRREAGRLRIGVLLTRDENLEVLASTYAGAYSITTEKRT